MGRIIVKVAGRKYHRVYPFWMKFLNQLNGDNSPVKPVLTNAN